MRPLVSSLVLATLLTGCVEFDPESVLAPPVVTGVFESSSLTNVRQNLQSTCDSLDGSFEVVAPNQVICSSENYWPEGEGKVPVAFYLEQENGNIFAQAMMFFTLSNGQSVPISGPDVIDIIRKFLKNTGASNVFILAEI